MAERSRRAAAIYAVAGNPRINPGVTAHTPNENKKSLKVKLFSFIVVKG